MSKRELSFGEALNEALKEEMRNDARILVMGENVSSNYRAVTRGLFEEFGRDRVRDTPITESAFVGTGVGAAMVGLKPVVELMLVDFSLVAMDQILNQAAKTQYMLGGMVKIPLLMRAIYGAGTSSGSTHSETLYSLFAHMPGLKVIVPSNPYDAKGLLVASLRDENPKVFFEHRLLYRMRGEVPEEQYVIPLGKANIVKEGTDITVVATGMMVHRALEAAEELKDKSISLEVIDPRTIVPLDTKSILSSIEKTSRLIIVDEDYYNCSFSSEVAALAADEGYEYLSAPVKRITTPNVPIPYNPKLEKHILPDASKIISTAQKLMK